MPLFDWTGLDGWGVLRAVMFAGAPGDAAAAQIAAENFREGIQRDETAAARLARTRWLEANRAESSFPCGVVPQPDPPADAPTLNVLPLIRDARTPKPVIAVLLPSDLVFIPEELGSEHVVELGRLPRDAIREVDVVDREGDHVAEPATETFEAEALRFVVLRWSNGSDDEEERFAFRSTWLAWRAARRLLAAKSA